MSLTRRDFIKATAATTAAASVPAFAGDTKQPNILMIISDQLNAFTIGAAGCKVKTPNIDRLAKEGTRFENAYSSYPLCVPWRSSMAAGMYPHQFKQFGNNGGGRSPRDRKRFAEATKGVTTFSLVRDAGYNCQFTGKWHMTMPEHEPEATGVNYEKSRNASREQVLQKAEELIKGHEDDKPFFITASFDTPHEICGWRRSHAKGEDKSPPPAQCPPLPDNYKRAPDVPEPLLQNAGKPKTDEWGPDDWRQHRWAYRKYTEAMDEYVGRLVQTLKDSGHDKDTLVVFVADHGDGDSSHRWSGKVALWEESVRVPLILRLPGVVKANHVSKALVSTGLDLMPTLCDFAGGAMPQGYGGKSLKRHCLGDDSDGHDYVVSETNLNRSHGLMIRTDQFKYVIYQNGKNNEQFFDLQQDLGEKVNLIAKPEFKTQIAEHRRLLSEWCTASKYSSFKIPS